MQLNNQALWSGRLQFPREEPQGDKANQEVSVAFDQWEQQVLATILTNKFNLFTK